MKRDRHVENINAWWERMPGERYWLDVTGRCGRNQVLVTPRGEGKDSTSWTRRLITYVKGGDLVFHYDPSREAIVACSISHGRVEKGQLSWPHADPEREEAGSQGLPSWGIGLRQFTELDAAVPLNAIARIQWGLFPSLRALEDEVGDPLYYPFEMGSKEGTRPLSGYLFKLPALFVRSFPDLASVASRAIRPSAAVEDAPLRLVAPVPRPLAASR